MAWSLLGVILVEILLFAESIIVFLWRLLVRLIKWMHIKDNTKVLIDETQKRHAKRERQKSSKTWAGKTSSGRTWRTWISSWNRRQRNSWLLKLALVRKQNVRAFQLALLWKQAGASSQSASEDLAEESQSTSESEVMVWISKVWKLEQKKNWDLGSRFFFIWEKHQRCLWEVTKVVFQSHEQWASQLLRDGECIQKMNQ